MLLSVCMDESDDTDEYKVLEIDVDPHETKLIQLLEFAETNKAGTLSIRGDREDGSTQWGVVVVCGEEAGEIMDDLQMIIDEAVANYLARQAN